MNLTTRFAFERLVPFFVADFSLTGKNRLHDQTNQQKGITYRRIKQY